jgi:hypothetical protein
MQYPLLRAAMPSQDLLICLCNCSFPTLKYEFWPTSITSISRKSQSRVLTGLTRAAGLPPSTFHYHHQRHHASRSPAISLLLGITKPLAASIMPPPGISPFASISLHHVLFSSPPATDEQQPALPSPAYRRHFVELKVVS